MKKELLESKSLHVSFWNFAVTNLSKEHAFLLAASTTATSSRMAVVLKDFEPSCWIQRPIRRVDKGPVSSELFQERTPLKDEAPCYKEMSKFSLLSIAEDSRTSTKGQPVLKVQISKSGILVGPGDCVNLFTSGKQLPLLAQIIRFRGADNNKAIKKFEGRYFFWKQELPEECRAQYKWAKDEIIASDQKFTSEIACIENLIQVKPVEHFTWGDDYFFRVSWRPPN